MRGTILLFLVCMTGFAKKLDGVLVDASCYEAHERNISPWALDASRDRNYEVQYCRANARTKSFTVVQPDGQSFKLDSTGNAKAAEIVRNGDPTFTFVVYVTGEESDHSIKVDSIWLLRNRQALRTRQ